MIRRTTDPFEGIPVKSNVELVLRHYEDLVNGGDLSAADRDLSPEFIDHAAPPDTPPGPEATKAFIAMLREALPDIHVSHDYVVDQGDLVAVQARWQGTHLGSCSASLRPGERSR